jgi:hypothetical protein
MDLSELRKRFEEHVSLKREELNRLRKELIAKEAEFNKELQQFQQFIESHTTPKEET